MSARYSTHIAIILPNLEGGGAERVQISLAAEFVAAGHQVTFVLREARGPLLDAVPDGCAVRSLDVPRVRGVPLPLARALRELRPDAVLASMWPLTGLSVLANQLAGSKARLVVCEHTDLRNAAFVKGTERRLLAMAGRRIYAAADGVVTVSSGVADGLTELAGVPRESITVIHNPIRAPSNELVDPRDEAIIAWWKACDAALIAVGALKPAKAYSDMLEGLARLRTHTDARLLVIGSGDATDLERQAAALGISDAVRFAGYRDDPAPLLRIADALVLSSRREGFGNVLVEAMACGVPVVSTDCPSGPREILQDGRFGVLVPVGDPDALAKGIVEALDRSWDVDALKRRADDFAPKIAARRYLDLLLTDGEPAR